LNRAVTVHKQSHHFGGDAGDWIERYVERALAPKVNWVALLRNKLTFASQTITTFSKPDKRFVSRKMTLPGPKKLDNDSLENVKICIDTSGSISSKDIGIALAQIEQLFKQYHAEAELMYWDTDIRAIYEFKNVQELVKLKPMGGGGTDANCIFRYFEENKDYKIGKKKKPTIIIVFTDGYFGQIDKAYKKYKDTIWVVNGDKDFTPPFGSTARFKNED
jgi:predicted metal-dependent peptidase